jgi:hypothetical protein
MATSPLGRLLGLGRPRRRPATSALLITAGALAGVALGMFIADRTGGIDGLLRRGKRDRGVKRQAPRRSLIGSGGDGEGSEGFAELSDDGAELSPESIAHMHVRGVGSRASAPGSRGGGAGRGASGRMREGADDGVRELPVRRVPDEAALEARVLEAFINDPILRERAIDICASGNGVIELTGWVQARAEIGHALTLARGVPDVSAVIDRLAVRGSEPSRDHSGYRYAGPPPGGDASALRAD